MTSGDITSKLWKFALPLMLGNVMQQFYNLVDTWVVGRYIGADALAAVGASYSLMTFLTSVILGLCLGSSAFFSMAYGREDWERLRKGIFLSFTMICIFSLILCGLVFWQIRGIIRLLQVPTSLWDMMYAYLFYVFFGIFATFLYNYFANLLRGIGNSVTPLIFLGICVVLNIGLDLFFVLQLNMGIQGAAIATTISQYIAGLGLMGYCLYAYPKLRLRKTDCVWHREIVGSIAALSGYTCLQQSVMNFGILLVQGLVNSFGTTVMSAFAVAVKIDTIAYMPVQDFGNAFATFVAQNFGAGKVERIQEGIRKAGKSVLLFCVGISTAVCVFAEPLMRIFLTDKNREIISTGVTYLRIEGACYIGIGILFMLYGYYRGINKPKMSLVLTIISLGTRVCLAYILAKQPWAGVIGIWVSIPIGWFLADTFGLWYYETRVKRSYVSCMHEKIGHWDSTNMRK